MPFGTFPKIHPFWCCGVSLISLCTDLVLKIKKHQPVGSWSTGGAKEDPSMGGTEGIVWIVSAQTTCAGAMSAAKFDLPIESAGPSSQEFSSSSHHSDVSKVEVPFCPPTAKSRGWVDPTGII